MNLTELRRNLVQTLLENGLIRSKRVIFHKKGLREMKTNDSLYWDILKVFEKPLEAPSKYYQGFQRSQTSTEYDAIIENPLYFYYTNMQESEIIELTPEEFLRKVTPEDKYDLMMKHMNNPTSRKYAVLMLQGEKFPTPLISYHHSIMIKEGRHRAYAAKLAGIKKIPVLEIRIKS